MTNSIAADKSLQHLLPHAMQLIVAEQSSTGEIANYYRRDNGTFEYCFGISVSAHIADALAILDPLSQFFDAQALEEAGEQYRVALSRQALQIRSRVRRFLAWQQAADGTWRFHGNASGSSPDLATTACCAAVLIEGSTPSTLDAARYTRGFACCSDYASLLRGSDSQDAAGYVGILDAIRSLALAGGDAERLASVALQNWQRNGAPMSFPLAFAAARAWAQTRISSLADVASMAHDFVTSAQQPDGGFGGPLSSAIGLNVLMYLEGQSDKIENAATAVLQVLNSPPSRRMEALLGQQCASPALTTAFAVCALLRAARMLSVGLA